MAFKIYDFLGPPDRLTGIPNPSTPIVNLIYGLEPCEVDDREYHALYQGGPTIDYSVISQSRAQALGSRLVGKCDVLCLNIEHIYATAPNLDVRDPNLEIYANGDYTTDQQARDDLTNYFFAAPQYVREGGFSGLIGNYNIFPTNAGSFGGSRNSIYSIARYAPAYDNMLATWRERNDVVVEHGYLNYYNCFMPTLYPQYAPDGNWTEQNELDTLKRKATIVLTECRRLSPSTPVLFFVRPSQGVSGNNWVYLFSAAFMEELIRHCKEIGADGAIPWEGYGTWAALQAGGHTTMLSRLAAEFNRIGFNRARRNRRKRNELL